MTQPSIAQPTSPQANITPETTTDRQLPGGPPEPSDPRWKKRETKRRIDPQYEWKMPINFFGRVVDENEQPVPGARIELSWTDFSPAGSSQTQAVTDAQGSFSLVNKTGRHLEVRVSKDGYYTPKRQQISFDYAGFWEANYHEPNPNNPVIFRLRKMNQGEALRSGEFRPTIPADGTPVRFDLLNGGKVSSDGQLELAAVTNTDKYPPRIFNWQASILVPGGGLVEYNDEFPFEAPEDGYQPSAEFDMPTNALNWRPLVQKSYFIEFGSPPRYGRIQIQLNGASQKASISYWVNPTGSRNLEASSTEHASSR